MYPFVVKSDHAHSDVAVKYNHVLVKTREITAPCGEVHRIRLCDEEGIGELQCN